MQAWDVMHMNVKYIALGMVFLFIGVAGLLYFHGMAIVQPEQGTVEASEAKSLILLGLYMGMGCLTVGIVGGFLIGYAIYNYPAPPPETLLTEPPEMRFCRYCGAENRNDALFCEKCGKRI